MLDNAPLSDEKYIGLHNDMARSAVAIIITPMMSAGAKTSDIFGLLESVVVGVLMSLVQGGKEGEAMEALHKGVTERFRLIEEQAAREQQIREAMYEQPNHPRN